MTVRELLARISSQELSEWIAFFAVEPWGTETEDYRMATIVSAIANANRDPQKQKEPFVPRDFMPQREKPQPVEPQSPAEQERILKMWQKAID